MGQMVRGGRSWPSETKLAGGASRDPKTARTGGGPANAIGPLTNPGAQQEVAHRLHLSAAPA